MEKNQNIVQNSSKAYGYNYASLSDIASQGYKIPKMKTGTDNCREYVFYYDEDLKDWMRGSEIIIPENIVSKEGKTKMNSAQLYGSAITYARRYTVLMALCLACDDDKNLETGIPVNTASNKTSSNKTTTGSATSGRTAGGKKMGVVDLCIEIEKRYNELEIKQILDHYNKMSLPELDYNILEQYYRNRKPATGNAQQPQQGH